MGGSAVSWAHCVASRVLSAPKFDPGWWTSHLNHGLHEFHGWFRFCVMLSSFSFGQVWPPPHFERNCGGGVLAVGARGHRDVFAGRSSPDRAQGAECSPVIIVALAFEPHRTWSGLGKLFRRNEVGDTRDPKSATARIPKANVCVAPVTGIPNSVSEVVGWYGGGACMTPARQGRQPRCVALGGAFLAPAHAPDAGVVGGQFVGSRHSVRLCEVA